jgi:hypothetical protein
MRQKLNENPLVQAAALGALAILVGLMLLMRMGGGAAEPPASAETGTLTPSATDPAATVDPAAAETAPVPSGAKSDFKAGPGLPADVVAAYDSGQAVALLIVNDRGIDDRDLQKSVQSVGSRADVKVFVTDVKDVADYSRITEGANIDRTPALIVMRPKRFSEGSMPTVSVAYGFRGHGSVQQAFEDALYDGPHGLPYYP